MFYLFKYLYKYGYNINMDIYPTSEYQPHQIKLVVGQLCQVIMWQAYINT